MTGHIMKVKHMKVYMVMEQLLDRHSVTCGASLPVMRSFSF